MEISKESSKINFIGPSNVWMFFTPSEKHNKQRHTETLLLLSDLGFNSPLIETRRQLAPKRAPQLLLGSLRRSAIGHFSLSLVTIPEVFAKVNSAQFV